MNIVVVGSINMDLVVCLPRIPRPGETLLGGDFNTFPGGKGANQAVAAARLGAHVSMIGCVGADAFGRDLIEQLSKEGVDTSFVTRHAGVSTGVALIQVDDKAQNSIAVASGANLCFTGVDVESALAAINGFDVLLMQLETSLDTVNTAAKVASKKKATIILNPAPAQVLEPELLQMVDYLIPNEFELAALAGLPSRSKENVIEAANVLISKGVKNLIVTLGEKGSMLFTSENKTGFMLPGWKVNALDTTAAGDCYVAAFAVGLRQSKTIEEAANFASAAAAISVTRKGAQPSLPYFDEVIQFIREGSKNS